MKPRKLILDMQLASFLKNVEVLFLNSDFKDFIIAILISKQDRRLIFSMQIYVNPIRKKIIMLLLTSNSQV